MPGEQDTKQTKTVALVIVLYNPNPEDLIQVEHLSALYPGAVVDNSDSPHFPSSTIGKMAYQSLGANYGIAKAQNVGMRLILDNGSPDFIVFLDQDSRLDDGYPLTIAHKFDSISQRISQLAILGPTIMIQGTQESYHSIIHRDHQVYDDFIPRREVISSGSCMAVEAIGQVGMNDESLFIDFVDFEWCWRARAKGYLCGVTPAVTITHKVGHREIHIGGYLIILSAPFRYYYQFRNFLWLSRRKYVPLQWKIATGVKHLARLCYFPVCISHGSRYWRQMVRGMWAGIHQQPK